MRTFQVVPTAGLALAAFSAQAVTICVNPANPVCAPTIQDGVDAASTGDVVKIAKGTYFEAVSVTTDGITLAGSSAASRSYVGTTWTSLPSATTSAAQAKSLVFDNSRKGEKNQVVKKTRRAQIL